MDVGPTVGHHELDVPNKATGIDVSKSKIVDKTEQAKSEIRLSSSAPDTETDKDLDHLECFTQQQRIYTSSSDDINFKASTEHVGLPSGQLPAETHILDNGNNLNKSTESESVLRDVNSNTNSNPKSSAIADGETNSSCDIDHIESSGANTKHLTGSGGTVTGTDSIEGSDSSENKQSTFGRATNIHEDMSHGTTTIQSILNGKDPALTMTSVASVNVGALEQAEDALTLPTLATSTDYAQEVGLKMQGKGQSSTIDKKKRRVYFPSDSVVSSFSSAPEPWNIDKISTCTSEVLVKAYLQSCDHFGMKPIQSLLNQLQAINNFSERNETLTLKGERLDYRHCETLEEVLRRVRFRMFDLEGTHLDDEGAIALFDMIEFYESCTKLNIAFNKNICPRGWQACSAMLRRTPSLEYLDVKGCALNNQTMMMLGRSLRMGCALTTLHLENTSISGRPFANLMSAMEINQGIKELFLADNKLMPSDGIQLGHMLKVNHTLQLLDVRNNHLQDVGTELLCKGLYNQGKGLVTLVLWNNQITYQSMDSMAGALFSSESLETLNLGHNSITNEGIHRLKEGLLQNKSLLRIGLQAAKISCEGSVALAEFMADSPRLVRIDLRENDIKTGGLMALNLALKVSQSLTRIDLDKQAKRESGVKDYAEQQKRLLQDISNNLVHNRELLRVREEQMRLNENMRHGDQASDNNKQADIPSASTNADVSSSSPLPASTSLSSSSASSSSVPVQAIVVSDSSKSDHTETSGSTESSLLQGTVAENTDAEAGNKEDMNLLLPAASRTQCLESPAFVPEAAMPFVEPPNKLELSRESADTGFNDVPIELPLSPLCAQGESLRVDISLNQPNVSSHTVEQTSPATAEIGDSSLHSSNPLALSGVESSVDNCDKQMPHSSGESNIPKKLQNQLSTESEDIILDLDRKILPSLHSTLSANGIQQDITYPIEEALSSTSLLEPPDSASCSDVDLNESEAVVAEEEAQ